MFDACEFAFTHLTPIFTVISTSNASCMNGIGFKFRPKKLLIHVKREGGEALTFRDRGGGVDGLTS